MAIEYVASESATNPKDWSVRAETAQGLPIFAMFMGVGAQQRATAYALWMNGKWPLPLPPDPKELLITDTKGRKIRLVLSGIDWTSDQKRGTITARTKENIFTVSVPEVVKETLVMGETNDPPKP